MELQELIKLIVRESRGDVVAIAYEGTLVKHEGETWYKLNIQDGGGYYADWYALLDGEAVLYDPARIAAEDGIPAIEADLARREIGG